MNWTIEHIDEDGYILIETEGYFTGQDNSDLLQDLTHQPYWKPGTNILFDNRKRNYDENGLEYMRKISCNFLKMNESLGCGKIAILMKSVADFNLGREFEMLTDEGICADVRIFLNEAFALSWIKNSSNLPFN